MSSAPTIPLLRPEQRWFTPDEANALLPELLDDIESLIDAIATVRELGEMIEETDDPAERAMLATDISELQAQARHALMVLNGHGVDVKGLEPALLDFPAQRYGQQVCLCWREGEEAIAWWHPLHTGVAGREPIASTPAEAWEYWS